MCLVGFGEAVFGALLSRGDGGLFSLTTHVSLQKHQFLEGRKPLISVPRNQALVRADSGRFLEGGWGARQAVPTPIPSRSEMTHREAPEARRVATCSGFTPARGCPNRFPFDLASRSPAFTLCPASKPFRTRPWRPRLGTSAGRTACRGQGCHAVRRT